MTWRGVTIDPAAIGALVGVLASMWRSYRTDQVKRREIAVIRNEMTANGGSSLRDAVNRIESALTDLTTAVAANRDRIEQIERERPRRWGR